MPTDPPTAPAPNRRPDPVPALAGSPPDRSNAAPTKPAKTYRSAKAAKSANPADSSQIETPRPRRRRPRLSAIGGRQVCLCVTLCSGAWIIALLLRRQPIEAQWIVQVMLAMAAMISSAWVSFEQTIMWRRPTRRLAELIEEIRRGECPIDELSRISGGPAAIAMAVQDVFRDLRLQRRQYLELQQEIRQRVANRTDALERIIGSLRRQTQADPLTGLYNRRALDANLPAMVERCAAERLELSLIIFDVDHFKQVNDTLGHPAGDKLLRDVASLIRSGIREDDLAFRYGGDEFVVLLPGQDRTDATRLATRLRRLTDELARTLHVPLPPRLSFGISALDELPEPSARMLLQEADQRLYELKHARQRQEKPAA